MGRDELLKQKRERDAALNELNQKYKDPAGIKYDLLDETGNVAGSLEYMPKSDSVILHAPKRAEIDGNMLKSLRDALNKLLDE